MLCFVSDKAKLFVKHFSKNSDLDDSGISLPRTNLKLRNIHVTPKLVGHTWPALFVKSVCSRLCSCGSSEELWVRIFIIPAELFNMYLKESCWKVSSVVLVFKNVWERSIAKNYRPVSLLSVDSKVFEKINNWLVDHLKKCGLLPDFQYGFRFSRSTADLLTVIQ